MKKYLLLILCSIIISGCATAPLNQRQYSFYYGAGTNAEANNDLELAKKNFYKASWYAQTGLLGAEKEAWAIYEWARITGYLGDYEASKKAFIAAIELLEKANGNNDQSITPMLCELGHLHHDYGFYNDAAKAYNRVYTLLNKTNISQDDPIGYALLLESYSDSLKNAGQKEESLKIQEEARILREANIDKEALHKPKKYK